MLKKNSQFLEDLFFISDLTVVSAAWLAAYYLRFYVLPVREYGNIAPFETYLVFLVPVAVVAGITFRNFDFYRSKRMVSRFSELVLIIKAVAVLVTVLVAATFFLKQFPLSRLVFVMFGSLCVAFLSAGRFAVRSFMGRLRKKGFNQRYALIAGTGPVAVTVAAALLSRPDVGLVVEGLVSVRGEDVGARVSGFKVLGALKDMRRLIRERDIDHVIFALGFEDHGSIKEVVKDLNDEAVDIKVVPDVYELMTLRGGIEEFEGIPLVTLQDSPLYGWDVVIKRSFDAAIALVAIAITAPLMCAIALLIKATSNGAVLYAQERMSIGGDTFSMFKFRSMAPDAEDETGAVWAKKDDPRRTRFGAFLRKTSLDELPQFFNVLKGDMSLVGPRPERPVFIAGFRKNVRNYMLRHKMKAGITGWAQVNGLRGDTDIKKRVEHDLYYIENWSLSFDMKIILLTVWNGFVNKNAY